MTILLLTTVLAHADVAPDPGFVETCTIEKQCKEGEEGTTCSAGFRGREECEKLEKEGWKQRCRTYGGSFWNEVMCRAKKKKKEKEKEEEPDKPPPPPPQENPPVAPENPACSTAPATAGWGALWLSALLALRRRT